MKRILALCLLFASCSNGTTTKENEKKEDPKPEKKESVEAGDLKFDVPESWKKVKPKSRMRKAEYHVADKEGVQKDAVLSVIKLGGFSGSMEDNLARWYGQVDGSSEEKNPPEEFEVNGLQVTMVDLEGTYSDQFSGETIKDARFLMAAVELAEAVYYIKLVGPKDTVDDWGSDFRKLVDSCKQ